MWKIPYRCPLAYSVDGVLRLLVCQQLKKHLAALFIQSFCSAKSLLKKSERFFSCMKRCMTNRSYTTVDQSDHAKRATS